MPEADARRVFQQMMVAVDYCHRLGIANRDIKVRAPQQGLALNASHPVSPERWARRPDCKPMHTLQPGLNLSCRNAPLQRTGNHHMLCRRPLAF